MFSRWLLSYLQTAMPLRDRELEFEMGMAAAAKGEPRAYAEQAYGPNGADGWDRYHAAAETRAQRDAFQAITVLYTNYRGETSLRTITPVRVYYGKTDWHPTPGWLLHCYDWDKQAYRDYELSACNFVEGAK